MVEKQMQTIPLVSVVTPVYNGESYITECIESVLNQTYANFEYIIVNNCSNDRTLEIAQDFYYKDDRIHIYTNKNILPIMKNWNYAVSRISPLSKYVKIVHADDWLFPNCIELMVETAERHPSVGIVSSYALENNRIICDGLDFNSEFIPGKELCRYVLLERVYPFYQSSILMRSDAIRNRRHFYNEHHLHADVESCYELLRDYDFGFVHQVLSFVRKHDDSVTNKEATPYNKIMLSNLDLLTRYGAIYLHRKEYKSQLKKKINNYYGFLVRSFFQLRERSFWCFQFKAFNQIGYRLKISKFAYKVIGAMIFSPLKNFTTVAMSIRTILSNK